MAQEQYDVAIIGSGPGGYVAAIRCAQLGMKTALIERYDTLGGTCLNVGCIPSKALLDSTEHFQKAKEDFAEHGIKVDAPSVDMKQMIKRKDQVVEETVGGVQFLMKKHKVDVIHGHGSFTDPNTVEVSKGKGKKKEEIKSKKFIIATGSKPSSLPGVEIDKERVISSTEALTLQEVPEKMVVIGGGYIGLEMGSVYARLGCEVTVVEYMDRIIPGMDTALGKELQKTLKKEGINFKLGYKVNEVRSNKKKKEVTVKAEDPKGNVEEFKGNYCLVAVGRRPYTDSLGLDKAGVRADDKGFLPVDEQLRTNVEHIHAIGDVVGGKMLAHKAEEEGIFVAEKMMGQSPHVDYNLVPGVVYTWPEVASVGKTEEELKEAGTDYKSGQFPFKASGRARASGDTEGFIKVLADKETDEVLGVHMMAPRAADLIMEAVAAMEYRATAEDIARMSHPHPTYSESVKEAALAATENRPLHI
jgi:dihydrolipoamide dehydrogenase